MSKGYFFTIDAVIAVILIIIFSGFMVMNHPATDNSKVFENYKQQTEDAAIVSYYFDETPLHFDMDSDLTGANTGYCSYNFEYDLSNGTIVKTKYCKGDN